jgi:hypothetical protein
MNVAIKTLLVAGGMIASLFVGYYFGIQSTDPTTNSEPETRILRLPGSVGEYKSAFMSPITIYANKRGDTIYVVADDTYKETKQSFQFPEAQNMITTGIGYGISGPAALGMYQRRVIGDVWAGGQAVIGEGYAAMFLTASFMW